MFAFVTTMVRDERDSDPAGRLIAGRSRSAAWSRSCRCSPSRRTIEPVRACGRTRRWSCAGRDIYVREGCYNCHSQMIRPFRDEAERYGHYSLAAESIYDQPFQWGSKRTGPDLARVGGKYSDDWHRAHLNNPRDVVPESMMPHYAFLAETAARHRRHPGAHAGAAHGGRALHRRADRQCEGRPEARPTGRGQRGTAGAVSEGQRRGIGVTADVVTEMDALVAYLQMLGTLVNFADTNTERLQQ